MKNSRPTATIRITDLTAQTFIGTNDWEKKQRQDIVINIALRYDAGKAIRTDALENALDYKALKQKILHFLEDHHCGLLEKLVDQIIGLIMEDRRILSAAVRIDKPSALRFTKTVSVEMERSRK